MTHKTIPFPYPLSPQNEDEKFMGEALKEAWKAYLNDEVPVGAVLVHKQKIIARGYNQVELLQDATAHAEVLCITAAEAAFEDWRLIDTTLYCTLEPCTMCAGAMMLARVSNLVWGAPDIRHGANGSWINVFEKSHPMHNISIRKGVLSEYCAKLLKDFFQKRRVENNEQKKSLQQ